MLIMNADQVNHTIQRWRDTQEEDQKPEDYQQLRDLGYVCLTDGGSEQLLKFLQGDKNQEIVKSMGCVLVEPLVSEVIRKQESLDNCQASITYLTKTCSPKKLLQSLLEVIEDIDPGAISETILTLLPHLQTVLLRLEERKECCVGLVLSAVQKQLSRLPVPYTRQQEEADEHGLGRCCSALLRFTKPFVEEVKGKDENCVSTTEDERLKIELLKFCMRSLRDPLLEAELNPDRKSTLWVFAAEIMIILAAIRESLSGLLVFSSLKKSTVMDKESTACLAYLLFVQLMAIGSFPAVFSPVFILQCNMQHVSQLLSSNKESHLLKGLALLGTSLEKVDDGSLPVGLLELSSFYRALQNLRRVVTDCPLEHLRKSGLQVFQKFINKLDAEAKHKFFRCMLKTSNHAGIEGYIVKNIRSQIGFSMKGNASDWFLGKEVLSLLGLVLSLPRGPDTDVLTSMDKIMESLNLLRFVLIRVTDLQAGVCQQLCRMNDEYLKLLRVCISRSRSYYSSELRALREDQKLRVKEARDAARSSRLPAKQEEVSSMSPEVQNQVMQSALVTFDLMESLIARIEEIAEEKLTKAN